MTDQQTNSIQPVESYDPLRRFLVRTLHLSPLKFGLLIFIADALVDGWLGWHYKVFLTTSGSPGLLQDYMALITDFVFNPVICGTYLWTIEGTTRLLQQLQKSCIFKSDTEFNNIVDKHRPLYRKREIFYIAAILSLLFAASQILGYMDKLPWNVVAGYLELQPVMSFARAPFWFLTFYSIAYGAFNVGATIYVLQKMFDHTDIQLLPLHPDGCGGLGSISQYSTRVAFAIGAIGLMISAGTVLEVQQGTLLKTYPVIAGIVAYLILAPIFFFLPLGTAHEAMQEAKDAEVLRLARQFADTYDRVKKTVAKQVEDYEKDIKKLENLKKLYQIAEEFPVWPFDIRNLRRFLTIITTPLLPAIISVLSQLFSQVFLR